MADEGSIAVKCIYGQNNVRCSEKYYGQVYFMCSSCHALWFRFVFRYAQIDSLEPLFSPQRALCSSISREALIFEDILRICYVIFMSRFLVSQQQEMIKYVKFDNQLSMAFNPRQNSSFIFNL